MNRKCVLVVAIAIAMVSVARSGHELPVYPSYYPHEIEIATLAPERAAAQLVAGKLHAYVGEPLRLAGLPSDSVQKVESLGAFLVVRANPALAEEAAACAAVQTMIADLAGRGGEFVFHPYPVTPMHGDFLYHVDLAEAAKARLSIGKSEATRELKVRAESSWARSLVRPAWLAPGREWDVEIVEIDAAALAAASAYAINGWLGPPWLKEGWFHAYQVLAAFVAEPATKGLVEAVAKRLQEHAYDGAAERINLERELVTTLTRGCRARIAGYGLKREYFNAEFAAGIENIGFDSIAGMNSAMFLRTAKLKDFPWNGWLALGVATPPAAAWNPIAGFGDPFGRLLWSAIGDPMLLPSPYDSAWMLNRASEVEAVPAAKTE